MDDFNRLLKIFADDFRGSYGFIECAIKYLNKNVPKYTWSKYMSDCHGDTYIMSSHDDKLIKRHQIDFEYGWKTKLADFLENEVLLQKLNIILDEK